MQGCLLVSTRARSHQIVNSNKHRRYFTTLFISLQLFIVHLVNAIDEDMNLYYTEDLLTKILDSKAPFDNFEQEEACQVSTKKPVQGTRPVGSSTQDYITPSQTFFATMHAQLLVNELSDEDQEVAARTSYAYWYAATTMHKTVKDCLSPNIRRNMAMKEARRHLVGRGGDYDGALAGLQGSVDYRKVSRP